MTRLHQIDTCLPDVLVPRAMLAKPDRFGGTAVAECLAGDLLIRDGCAAGLVATEGTPNRMVLPRFTEPHVHLDKCHTIDRMQGVGGDLAAAISAQRRDKITWTEEDIRGRASRGLRELEAAGCAVVRTHVDWDGATPTAWEVLGALASASSMTVQRSALIDITRMADPEEARRFALLLSRDGGVPGAFVFDQPERDAGLANMFREADRLGLPLDFHVDEGLAEGLDGLERIADAALEVGFEGPVLCGHACSLANFPETEVARIADKLARAGIAVAMLPQTNLYLQGRVNGTPDRRGVTRIRELRSAGVTVTLGADNVRDAFCPIGRHDPLHILGLSVLAAHLDPPLGDHFPLITTNAQRALGLASRTVDGAAIGDLLVFDATDSSELLCGVKARSLTDALGALL